MSNAIVRLSDNYEAALVEIERLRTALAAARADGIAQGRDEAEREVNKRADRADAKCQFAAAFILHSAAAAIRALPASADGGEG